MSKEYVYANAYSFDFYRNAYRTMIKIAIFLSIIILGELCALFYFHFTEPEIHYYITTSSGEVIQLTPETR